MRIGSKPHALELGRRPGVPLDIKRVVNYNKNWVRSANRMSATSNQECFSAKGLCGRLSLDYLRPILTAHSLSFFSLDECVAVFLGEEMEVLSQDIISALWGGAGALRASAGAGAGSGCAESASGGASGLGGKGSSHESSAASARGKGKVAAVASDTKGRGGLVQRSLFGGVAAGASSGAHGNKGVAARDPSTTVPKYVALAAASTDGIRHVLM